MILLSSLAAGLLFGIGMIISGMINPEKVINFLDLTGAWDPSLAFVLGGAVIVGLPGFSLVRRQLKPLFHDAFHLPMRKDLDPKLAIGGGLFGVGWGLSGFCPGPAISAAPLFLSGTGLFLLAMLVGMWLAKLLEELITPSIEQAA